MADSGSEQRSGSRLAAALLLAVPIAILLGPVLLSDRSLAMRDAGHFYHPLLQWTSERWLEGMPPLWNPYENAGLPLLADGSSSLYYPGRLLLLLPIDFIWRYKLYVLAHVVLAAFGSYLLARHWRASAPAATMAAIAYSCGGSVVFQHANVVYLVGAAWLPLAAWALDAMLVARSWRAVAALAAALAMMVLGGDAQMAYHLLLMGGIYAVVLAFQPGLASATPRHWLSLFGQRMALLGLAAAGGMALAAIQVLPSLEAAAASDRAYYERPRSVYEAANELARHTADGDDRWPDVTRGIAGQPLPGTHHQRLYEFSLPPWRLIEVLWPNIGGRMFPIHRRWLSLIPADARIWTPTIYCGLLPLLLAIGQWRWRGSDATCVWLSWLLLVFTLGSFGWYGLGWCGREFYATVLGGDPDQVAIGSPVGGVYWLLTTFLPGYVSFRYPAKLLIVAALAASQLAARGWDNALAYRSPRLAMRLKQLAVVSLLLLIGCWFGFSWLNRKIEQAGPLGQDIARWLDEQGDDSLGPFDLGGSQRDVYLALLHTSIVCLVGRMLLRRIAGSDLQRWNWGLVALVALDVAAANYWLVPSAPADNWRSAPLAAEIIQADVTERSVADRVDRVRVFRGNWMGWRPPSFRHTSSPDRMAELAAWERDTLFPKYGLNHGISLVESYSSLKPADYQSLFSVARQFGPGSSDTQAAELPDPQVLRLLGTEYLVLPSWLEPTYAGETPFAELVWIPANLSLPEDASVWRLKSPLPRAWIVHDVKRLPPLTGHSLAALDERTRDVLFASSADRRHRQVRDFGRTAVIETASVPDLPSAPQALAAETCRVQTYDLHRLEIQARLTHPGLVVLSDRYAPGWVATIETKGRSRRAPVLRTNRVCRGVLLPAGQHLVRLEYRPQSFRVGSWISGIAAVVLLGWLARRLVAERWPRGKRA